MPVRLHESAPPRPDKERGANAAAPRSIKSRDGEHDPEMHQTKSGNQWHFGMTAHIGVNEESDLVHHMERAALLNMKSIGRFDAGIQASERFDQTFPSMGRCCLTPTVKTVMYGMAGMALLFLTGCVSSRPFAAVPEGSPPLARQGTHGVLVMWKAPPLWKVYTYFHIPGEGGSARFARTQSCPDNRVDIRVGKGIERVEELGIAVCEAASSALAYLDTQGERMTADGFTVRMHVVPEGQAAWRRTIHLGRTPRLSLAVPLFEDRARTLAAVVEVVTHEGSHMVDRLRGIPHPESFDAEKRAYRHQLCGQLMVLGRLYSFGLPSPVFIEGEGPVSRNTQAGRLVFLETMPLLESGAVELGTPAADVIMQRCREY